MTAKVEQPQGKEFIMRVWVTLGLIAFANGCGGTHEDMPAAAKAPAMNHGGQGDQAMPSKDAHGSHGNHGGHENLQMVTQRKLVIGTEPSQPQAGTPTKLLLQIMGEDGSPIRRFDVLHEKLVHLIVVREGLDEFAHLHPEVDSEGMITIEFDFPKSGKYRLFADHQPQGKTPGLAAGELIVAGDDGPAVALVPNAASEVTVGEIKAHITIQPANDATTVRFQIVDAAGQAVDDLQPYLGAMGHLVVISAVSLEYVLAHPLSEARTAPDGTVEFLAHFPKPGIYKAWGQFQRVGSVFTVPFVMDHGTKQ